MTHRKGVLALGGLGIFILIATAGLHMLGLPLATAGKAELSEPFFAALLEPLWTMPSLHWLIFALLAGAVLGRSDTRSRLMLGALGGALLFDAAMIALQVGPFIGAICLASSGALLCLAALLVGRAPQPA